MGETVLYATEFQSTPPVWRETANLVSILAVICALATYSLLIRVQIFKKLILPSSNSRLFHQITVRRLQNFYDHLQFAPLYHHDSFSFIALLRSDMFHLFTIITAKHQRPLSPAICKVLNARKHNRLGIHHIMRVQVTPSGRLSVSTVTV